MTPKGLTGRYIRRGFIPGPVLFSHTVPGSAPDMVEIEFPNGMDCEEQLRLFREEYGEEPFCFYICPMGDELQDSRWLTQMVNGPYAPEQLYDHDEQGHYYLAGREWTVVIPVFPDDGIL